MTKKNDIKKQLIFGIILIASGLILELLIALLTRLI
jgi:hypothetical protein